MSNPIAVLISDVHYNLTTLPLADAAMRQAIAKANDLDVPLVVAGDLHDSKANMRAECVNAMIETFELCEEHVFVIVGNHDLINEKGQENSLNFLKKEGVHLIESPVLLNGIGWVVPYYSNPDELRAWLKEPKKGYNQLIMHQGLEGSHAGDYIQDKSAIQKEDVADFRVISGHYHSRQDIKTGRPQKGAVGLFSYIGNPYTLNYGEANDPKKGFQILMDNGTLEFVPTNLRKHVIVELEWRGIDATGASYLGELPDKGDLTWIKVSGTKEAFMTVTRSKIANLLGIEYFKLDLIPTDTETEPSVNQNLTQAEVLDKLIDSLSNTTDYRKTRLKELWRKSVCE